MVRLIAVVFAFLLLASGAQAECLLKPDLSQKNGYWRYRIDRKTHQHCWYLSAGRGAAHSVRSKASKEAARSEKPEPKEAARESKPKESPKQNEAARSHERQPLREQRAPVSVADAQPSAPAGLNAAVPAAREPNVTAAYLVDDAWNVIGLEQAPGGSAGMVARLKRLSKPVTVALAASAPVVPVQEGLLEPLHGAVAASPEPTFPSDRVFAVVLVWLLSMAAVMWWLRPRQQPIALPFSLLALRRTLPDRVEEDPPVVTQLRLLTEVVASQRGPAHEDRELERRRAGGRRRG